MLKTEFMKIRLAKKIMLYNPNAKVSKNRMRRFNELRPPYLGADGRLVFPSCHDINIVRRANIRLRKWLGKGSKQQWP